MRYRDRTDAGRVLAGLLRGHRDRPDACVLGLARGGVAVAAPIAAELGLPLDVLVVRKLGLPWAPEVAFGAVGPGGVDVRSAAAADRIGADRAEEVVASARAEVDRRVATYRGERPPLDLAGWIALLVDDGLATGATALAAVAVARTLGAAFVVLAVPVGSPDALAAVARAADSVVCPRAPADFAAVSHYYRNFAQVTDNEVIDLLNGRR